MSRAPNSRALKSKPIKRVANRKAAKRALFDPAEFLAYARTHRPPLVIADIWMPLMNGLEVQSRLREISPSTRVIIFTGKDDPEVRSTAVNAGAFAFFIKPVDNEEFVTAIRLAICAT